MLIVLFIILICYMPIVDNYIPRTKFGPGIPDIGGVLAISYFLFLYFLLQWSILKNVRFFNKWIILLTIYSLVVLSSVYWSDLSYNGATLHVIFNTVFIPLFITIIAIHIFQEQININTFIKHLIISGLILSLISIFQMISGILMGKTAIRSTGPFSKPNGLAMYIVMIIPSALYAIEYKLVPRVFGRLAIVSMVGGVLCTVSRKGTATMILAFCIYNFLKKRYRQVVFTLAGFIFIAAMLSGSSMIFSRFQQSEVSSEMGRKMSLTHAGWEMFKSSPIIGLGFQGFKSNYNRYFPDSHRENYDAHNVFITLLSDYGLLGFLSFIAVLFYPLFLAGKQLQLENYKEYSNNSNCDDHTIRNFAIICIAVVIPFTISAWFAGNLLFNDVMIFLFYSNVAMFIAQTTR